MEQQIYIGGKHISYRVARSSRARTMRLTVHCDGTVALTLPKNATNTAAKRFLNEKASWLLEKVSFYERFTDTRLTRLGIRDYQRHKEAARTLVHQRVTYFAEKYGYRYNRITIRDQKRAWGSCSSKGNLNFNYKVLFLPEALQDYVIVHELCHLAEMNHSKRFWDCVVREVPNYKELRKQLHLIL